LVCGILILEPGVAALRPTHHVTALAQITATSFFPAKPLRCYGDGGCAFIEYDELAEAMRSIRVHGQGRDK
jgi:UDP-2-acetamido-2-deoxy-ribo-hexuluronate aminotransferase